MMFPHRGGPLVAPARLRQPRPELLRPAPDDGGVHLVDPVASIPRTRGEGTFHQTKWEAMMPQKFTAYLLHSLARCCSPAHPLASAGRGHPATGLLNSGGRHNWLMKSPHLLTGSDSHRSRASTRTNVKKSETCLMRSPLGGRRRQRVAGRRTSLVEDGFLLHSPTSGACSTRSTGV